MKSKAFQKTAKRQTSSVCCLRICLYEHHESHIRSLDYCFPLLSNESLPHFKYISGNLFWCPVWGFGYEKDVLGGIPSNVVQLDWVYNQCIGITQ